MSQYKYLWNKSQSVERRGLKSLSFAGWRGFVYAVKGVHRDLAVENGWFQTKAKNRYLLWKDEQLGRLEWYETGRINLIMKKPVTKGRIKQLLANAFYRTGLIYEIEVFDKWANSVRLKGFHVVKDVGVVLPYCRIDMLKESNGIIVKIGDKSHPTGVEIEAFYPGWAERLEILIEKDIKIIEKFSDFM